MGIITPFSLPFRLTMLSFITLTNLAFANQLVTLSVNAATFLTIGNVAYITTNVAIGTTGYLVGGVALAVNGISELVTPTSSRDEKIRNEMIAELAVPLEVENLSFKDRFTAKDDIALNSDWTMFTKTDPSN